MKCSKGNSSTILKGKRIHEQRLKNKRLSEVRLIFRTVRDQFLNHFQKWCSVNEVDQNLSMAKFVTSDGLPNFNFTFIS